MSKSGLGRRLYDVRRKHRLTQEKMADRLSISRSAYQYYERGERDLTSTVLMKISREFKVDPIWLAGGSEDGKRPREKKITEAYRDVGIAVERRVLEICPNMSSGKKWDAIDFLFDEAFDFNPLEPDYQTPTLKKIDAVLRLIT